MGVVKSGIAAADAGDGVKVARRRAILILGMHRSGTSALTRLLALCGGNLPRRLMEPNFGNPRGYWEPLDIVEIHQEMLAAAGCSWDSISAFPTTWLDTPEGQTYRSRLSGTFKDAFGNAPLALLKDPRICQFVPLWTSILQSLQTDPLFVIPVRNPLEVAASLKARDEQAPAKLGTQAGMSEAKALLLWLRSFLDAERHTRGFPRSFVSYEALMSDWRAVVVRIADDLGITWPVSPNHIAPQVGDFLSADMRHHVSSTEELERRADIAPWLKEAYRWAQNAAGGQAGDTEKLDRYYDALKLADGALAGGISERDAATAELRRDLAAAEEKMGALAGGISERDAATAELRRDLAAAEEKMGALAGKISERDAAIAELHRDLAASGEKKGALAGGISERDAIVAELRRDLAAAAATSGELEKELAERDAMIAKLQNEVESTAQEAGILREELDERMRSLHALRQQLSEASARFAERLVDLRRSAEPADAGAASPISPSTKTDPDIANAG